MPERDEINAGFLKLAQELKATRNVTVRGTFIVDPTVGNGVADASNAIQAALDAANAAGGGHVYMRPGTYNLTRRVFIGNNTHLELAPNAIIRRAGTSFNIANKSDGVTGGYAANSNIKISGGIMDGNAETYPANNNTMLSFGHMTDLVIENMWFRNHGGANHMIEINSTMHGRVRNCKFTDFPGTSDPNRMDAAEVIQIDLAIDAGAFPPFGPYDMTPCADIEVSGCLFKNVRRGVGSHTQAANYPHREIRIINNHFENVSSKAIIPLNYEDLVVANNTGRNCYCFVFMEVSAQTVHGITITGNSCRNPDNAYRTVGGMGIYVQGSTAVADGRGKQADISISGNTLKGFGQYGIYCTLTTRVSITGNTCRDNGDIDTTIQAAGIKVWQAADTTIVGNQVVGNAGAGGSGRADIVIGQVSSVASDTIATIVANNGIGELEVHPSNVTLVHDNTIGTFTVVGTSTTLGRHHNMIGGVYNTAL